MEQFLRLFFCFNVPPLSLRLLGVFCAVAGGVWGGKRPHIWGEKKKILKFPQSGKRAKTEGGLGRREVFVRFLFGREIEKSIKFRINNFYFSIAAIISFSETEKGG